MKFLALNSLASITSAFERVDLGESNLGVKLDCYSCKKAGEDKKFYKEMEKEYAQEQSRSPKDQLSHSTSPFGPLLLKRSRELLIDLISVLNASFPDYDFSDARESQFVKEELSNAITQINARLGSVVPNYFHSRNEMWATIDKEIKLRECSIYTFTPDIDSNPLEDEGDVVWSFIYLFVEKKTHKRILLFTGRQTLGVVDHRSEDDDVTMMDAQTLSGEGANGDFGMEMLMDY